MRYCFLFGVVLVLLGCGTPSKQSNKLIIDNTVNEVVIEETDANTLITMPEIPEGAVSGNFSLITESFYAAVDAVDPENQTTTITFEVDSLETITIPEAVGASLSSVRFDGFDRDALLINSIYPNPIFRKYYLYILKDRQWHPLVDGFMLHVDNISEDMVPIKINPSNPNGMVRSYSVFDMDPKSDTKYTWILHEETVEVMNR